MEFDEGVIPGKPPTRTSVSVTIARGQVAPVSHALHQALSADVGGMLPRRVYLPDDTRAFGLYRNTGCLGAIPPNDTSGLPYVTNSGGRLVGYDVALLGNYFGWMLPSLRIEFATDHGETYTVTLTYIAPTGVNEEWMLRVLDVLLRHGRNSYAISLTPAAALGRTYDRVFDPDAPSTRVAG